MVCSSFTRRWTISVTLIVNNTPYDYPSPGDEPGWGEAATGWAEEVTDVLSSLLSPDDILQTAFTVNNNVASATNVTSLSFNTGSTRSARIEYNVYRISDSNPSGNAETGIMNIVYDNSASPGSQWSMIIGNIAGNSGVSFSITDAGQIQYISTDIGSVNYSGVMKFRAVALQQ